MPAIPDQPDLTAARAPGTSGRRPDKYPDLSFQVIGRSLALSPTYVGRVLNGVQRPSMQTAERLATLLGWSIDTINKLYTDKHPSESQHAQSRNNRRSSKSSRAGKRKTADAATKSNHARSGNRKRKTRPSA
jgi:hypothetical protein